MEATRTYAKLTWSGWILAGRDKDSLKRTNNTEISFQIANEVVKAHVAPSIWLKVTYHRFTRHFCCPFDRHKHRKKIDAESCPVDSSSALKAEISLVPDLDELYRLTESSTAHLCHSQGYWRQKAVTTRIQPDTHSKDAVESFDDRCGYHKVSLRVFCPTISYLRRVKT